MNWSQNYLWSGTNENKGIGIFAKAGVQIQKLDWPDDDLKFFLPARINDEFDLLACWCHGAGSPTFGYIGQLWKYIQISNSVMGQAVLVGDFNSNKIWDVWDRWWNHSDVLNELNKIGIRSLYHEYFEEEQGEEISPTLFLQRNIAKPYHIDYIMAPYKTVSKCTSVKVGSHIEWLKYSDHMPLFAEW